MVQTSQEWRQDYLCTEWVTNSGENKYYWTGTNILENSPPFAPLPYTPPSQAQDGKREGAECTVFLFEFLLCFYI